MLGRCRAKVGRGYLLPSFLLHVGTLPQNPRETSLPLQKVSTKGLCQGIDRTVCHTSVHRTKTAIPACGVHNKPSAWLVGSVRYTCIRPFRPTHHHRLALEILHHTTDCESGRKMSKYQMPSESIGIWWIYYNTNFFGLSSIGNKNFHRNSLQAPCDSVCR